MSFKENSFFFGFVFLCSFLSAQKYEIGIQIGATNLVGDIGRTNYIYPFPEFYAYEKNTNIGPGNEKAILKEIKAPFHIGLLFRLNLNPYQSLRFNLAYDYIFFDDRLASENYRNRRRFVGGGNLLEGSAVFEYNFFTVNNEQREGLFSPYIFSGIGTMGYMSPRMEITHDFYRTSDRQPIDPELVTPSMVRNGQNDFTTSVQQRYSAGMTIFIPFGVGIKYKFNYNWAIFGEFMFRYTFADDIDYSQIKKSNIKTAFNKDILDPSDAKKSLLQSDPYILEARSRETEILRRRQIGNLESKDWVNTMSLGVSYSFGRPPCYCD